MLDVESSLEAGDLLETVPKVRRRIINVGKHSFQGEPPRVEKWDFVVEFFEEADRTEEELEVVWHLRDEIEDGRALDEGDIDVVLELLGEAEDDLRSLIENRVAAGEPRDEEWSALEDELYEELVTPDVDTKEHRLELVEDFILDHPGLYVQKLHNRLWDETPIRVSYSGLLNYINELEEAGEILTVGGPKGRLRHCFPHPSKVPERERYFGEPWGIDGTVEDDVTDHFSPRGGFAEAYVVNHQMTPLILLTPSVALEQEEHVQGFGVLEHVRQLENRMALQNGAPQGIDEVLLPDTLRRGDGEEMEIPEEWRETFGYREAATQ